MKLFKSQKPHYEYLRKKWRARHKAASDSLLTKHNLVFDKQLRQAAIGSLGGLMLLTTPGLSLPIPAGADEGGVHILGMENKNMLLATQLIDKLPEEMRALTPEEEARVTEVLSRELNIKVVPTLEGKRLNRSYGLIGGEQHLYRYPGDNLYAHARSAQDWAMFGSAGIAPHLGAWGYFAPSKEQFSSQDEERERYYLAVQTFLAPGFSENVSQYRDFFKFRKMLVINPKTGQAVVAVVGDAGPAQWTGKHLGGSPEVMHELGLASGPRKGAVLYFFVDDPEDKIPLGPIKVAT